MPDTKTRRHPNRTEWPYEFRQHGLNWQRRLLPDGNWHTLAVVPGPIKRVRVGNKRNGATRVREIPTNEWKWI